jgi:circadian clock protein KaiC
VTKKNMTKKTATRKAAPAIPRIETGVRNLDTLFPGGLPKGSVTVVGGPPGAGKTILTQQICFHNASPKQRVLYFSTLSEPTAKTLRYLSQFGFFDATKLEAGMQFVDLGVILRADGLPKTSALIMAEIKKEKPSLVVIDSFKAFDDLAQSQEQMRKFGYELAVNLMAWEATTLLLGEYGPADFQTNPLFSIVDGLIHVSQREESGEQQRFLQVIKMRGSHHSRDEHTFLIDHDGVEVFAPRVTIRREDHGPCTERMRTGISKLDELLGDGIPLGSSLLVAGVAGTGKTVFLLEFLYRGAQKGEKGIIFTFEETEERLRAEARGLGWDLEAEIARGMVEICFIPQPDILVEKHLLMMQERIAASGARRVSVDSVSVFLHKVTNPQISREKIFQLASVIQNSDAVGLFATDIPYGSTQISRFGVEETVVDGIILLTSKEEGLERHRYLEVYKLRNTAHLKGRHIMTISEGGITVFPRYRVAAELPEAPAPVDLDRRLKSGVPGLDALCGGGLLTRSVTLVSGSAGIGKSTLALQFIAQGLEEGGAGLYVSVEEGPEQLLNTAAQMGLPLSAAVEAGRLEILYLSRERIRASQLLTVLADAIRDKKITRLVLDSVSHLDAAGPASDELRELLFVLMARCKSLGVTTLLTVESKAMYSTATVTDHGLSPIADNLIMLRYSQEEGERRRVLAVVKTRGSAHDLGTHHYELGDRGLVLGDR